jgi:hypothetical protein
MSQARSITGAAVAYCAVFGAALFLWLRSLSPQSLGAAFVCAVPALIAALALGRHRGEPSQLIAKTCACMLMPPAGLLLWSNEQVPPDTRTWPVLVTFAVGHVLAFIAFIVWAAPRSTRVEAVSSPPAGDAELRRALSSLVRTGLGVQAVAGSSEDLVLEYVHDPALPRSVRFVLSLEGSTHTLYVRELEGIGGAPPKDANEASLRSPGEPSFDPTRPDAQRIYGKSTNATSLDPARIAAIDPRIEAHGVRFGAAPEREVDAKHVAYALAAVTTRMGWGYQPILFDFQRREGSASKAPSN